MDIAEYSNHLADVMVYALGGSDRSKQPAITALSHIRKNAEASAALMAFLDNLGLIMVTNPTCTTLQFYPKDKESIFAFNADDLRRLFAGKSSMSSYAVLCVMATFYPNQASVTNGATIAIDAMRVLGTANKMYEHARNVQKQNPADYRHTLADEFNKLNDDAVEDDRAYGSKLTYINRALDALQTEGLVVKEDSTNSYLPTPALQLLMANRLSSIQTKMASIISDYHDATTTNAPIEGEE